MNTETDAQFEMENPIANVEPPRSNKKLWLFGGLGCLTLIGTVCFGAIMFGYYFGYKPMLDFQGENVAIATASPEVEAILGSPVTAGTTVPRQTDPQNQKFEFTTPLTGPAGDGKLVFGGKLEGAKWVREYIFLKFGEEEINLDPEAMFNLEITDEM